MKPRNSDGTTPVEAFLQQFRVCAHYYEWTEEESSVQMKCAISGDAATLVWTQINPEQLNVAQLQELLRETYGSAMQEEKFQAERRARRRKNNEDLLTLRADISRLMSLAFPGDVSTMGQKMAIDYFLDALDDSDFELKIRESEPKNVNEAYTRALRLEMIRKKVQKKELAEVAPGKQGTHTRAVEVFTSRAALNQEYQRLIEELQISTQKRIEESQAANQKRTEEQLLAMASEQKSTQLQQQKNFEKTLAAMASRQNAAQAQQQTMPINGIKHPAKPDYSNFKCFNCGKMGHSAKICKQPKPMPIVADRNCFHCYQPGISGEIARCLHRDPVTERTHVHQPMLARRSSTPRQERSTLS